MSTIKRTTCPFCLNGCTSAVEFDGYQYRMSYVTEAEVNQGRLCPRGNSTNIVIDHPKRIGDPLLDGGRVTWQRAAALVKEWLAAVRPEELAIVYSRGRASDEVRQLHGLARALGTPNLTCGHIEPENSFNARLAGTKDATLAQIESAKAMLLVGDVFNTSPVAAGRILAARYADSKSRLVVVDSFRTRQSGFAHIFIQVRPGTEPFVLLALAALLDRKLSGIDIERFADIAGVERRQLQAAADVLGTKVPGFVGSAMHAGRVFHPELHSLASQLVALKSGKSFVGFRETGLPAGTMSFIRLQEEVAAGHIRMVFWTGGLYPYSYSEVWPELGQVEFRVATSIFVPDPPIPGLVLPVTAELERGSSGRSYWGPVERFALASPYSGTRLFSQALSMFGRADAQPEAETNPTTVERVLKMAEKAAALPRQPRIGMLLMGEKKAIGLRGFHDPEDRVMVNPKDARELAVGDENALTLNSPTGSCGFRVRVTDAVPQGVLAIGTNVHQNRALFPLAVDEASGEATMMPAAVEVERASSLAKPVLETTRRGG